MAVIAGLAGCGGNASSANLEGTMQVARFAGPADNIRSAAMGGELAEVDGCLILHSDEGVELVPVMPEATRVSGNSVRTSNGLEYAPGDSVVFAGAAIPMPANPSKHFGMAFPDACAGFDLAARVMPRA
ncbi:hypothetical protein [Aeromicrobium massiliense]|uniref:hypothetical protein n=1 Tax=Aeromicrobium massiliense TaxID=1464554 RepID=UPI0011C99D98|nr:hypothetical protein [Aeromicrobium massiliense]